MTLFIGMDDTDFVGSEFGTGHLARELVAALAADGLAAAADMAVSRHQLLFDRRIPYTAKNSANVVHVPDVGADAVALAALADRVEAFMRARFQPGSDPGLCVAGGAVPAALTDWGRRAQREILTQDEARALAAEHGVILRGLGGTNGGIIGAMAGVGLAASGEDGRFTAVGRSRELHGLVSVEQALAHGIHAVRTREGDPVVEGLLDSGAGKIRPALRGGRAVLLVEPGEGAYVPLKVD